MYRWLHVLLVALSLSVLDSVALAAPGDIALPPVPTATGLISVTAPYDDAVGQPGLKAFSAAVSLAPYAANFFLENGWTVSAINWWQEFPNDSLFSTLGYTARAGTSDPTLNIDWWIRIFILDGEDRKYSFSIDIVGPKGTPYFASP